MRKSVRIVSIILFCGIFLFSSAHPQIFVPSVLAEEVQENTAAPAAQQPPTFTRRITMDLKGVDILDILKILSQKSGLNIVAGRNVRGAVTLYLQDVDVIDALNTILETSDLAYVEERGIIKVMTEADYQAQYGKPYYDKTTTRSFQLNYAPVAIVAQILGQIKSGIGKVVVDERSNTLIINDTENVLSEIDKVLRDIDSPLVTEVFTLRYAKAEELEPKLTPLLTPEFGNLQIDARSNKVVITDIEPKIERVREVIEAFDMQSPQVMIEAKVVEVELHDRFRYGIDWDLLLRDFLTVNEMKFTPTFPTSVPSSGLGSGGTVTTFTVGTGLDDLQGFIQFLENIGKTNILSSPRVTVINNEEARLAVATREPFVTQTVVQSANVSSTADTVQFIDVGVTLKVTPRITADDYVVLKIQPEVSTQGAPLELKSVPSSSNTEFVRSRIPVVTTQTVETTVVVKSGNTIVVGGLIEDKASKQFRKFPVLGDIPLIGTVFRSKENDFIKQELVVFLNPTIIYPDASAKREEAKWLDEKGELEEFEKVGGYKKAALLDHSQTPFKGRDRGFWKESGRGIFEPESLKPSPEPEKKPVVLQKEKVKEEISGKPPQPIIPLEKISIPLDETSVTEETRAVWGRYYQALKDRIAKVLRENPKTSSLKGEVRVTLTLDRSGELRRIVVQPTTTTWTAESRVAVELAILGALPFPPFPEGIRSRQEVFNFTILL